MLPKDAQVIFIYHIQNNRLNNFLLILTKYKNYQQNDLPYNLN